MIDNLAEAIFTRVRLKHVEDDHHDGGNAAQAVQNFIVLLGLEGGGGRDLHRADQCIALDRENPMSQKRDMGHPCGLAATWRSGIAGRAQETEP